MPERRNLGLYTMAATRALTGLTDRQLRYYDELGLVVPARSPGGHRLYSAQDVQRLVNVRRLRRRRMTMRQIARVLNAVLPPNAAAAVRSSEPKSTETTVERARRGRDRGRNARHPTDGHAGA